MEGGSFHEGFPVHAGAGRFRPAPGRGWHPRWRRCAARWASASRPSTAGRSGSRGWVAEVRRLRVLEEENRKLKQLVADLSLDKQMLQDVLRKKPRACSASGPRLVSSGGVWGERAASMPGAHPPKLQPERREFAFNAKGRPTAIAPISTHSGYSTCSAANAGDSPPIPTGQVARPKAVATRQVVASSAPESRRISDIPPT